MGTCAGGSLELGESVADAALREVYEETRLDAVVPLATPMAASVASFGQTQQGSSREHLRGGATPVFTVTETMAEPAPGEEISFHYVLLHVACGVGQTQASHAIPRTDVDALAWVRVDALQRALQARGDPSEQLSLPTADSVLLYRDTSSDSSQQEEQWPTSLPLVPGMPEVICKAADLLGRPDR